jgi:signal transduction histidine kinase
MDCNRHHLSEESPLAGNSRLAGVAHDLRTPLAAIEFSASRLLQGSTPDKSTLDRSLQAILRSVHRAKRLAEDVLDAATAEHPAFELRPAWVPAARLLADARLDGEPVAAQGSVTLTVEDGANLPLVWADPERIAQVFANLISNATKFTPAGGRITVGATSAERNVQFSVADTGPGIKEEDRARVFAPFWQADPLDQRGRGLGLSICKQIVEGHGGRIWIESRAGSGAVFLFALSRPDHDDGSIHL